jgi:hypothetical protein
MNQRAEFRRFWSAPVAAALFLESHPAREDGRHGFNAPSRAKAAQSRRTPRRFARNERLASPGFIVLSPLEVDAPARR